ncbi:MAG: 5-(carboxyamino)imidazole ribonucleotide synthase [Nevskiaceae bacterium]|jgi:5-(carboxyamino)imidazole ribonucleotide synthase|nr:5-(carboxyamino)imidazole ribonucleotide synthase [Nevskiaceae bacterium]
MTIGVLGAGQLGRMMALAGYPLGLDFLFLDREAGTPAHQVAPSLLGSFTDPALLDELAARCDVVTVDWENVPAAALERLGAGTRIAPPPAALAAAQDRLEEKALFRRLGIPTNRTQPVDSLADLEAAVSAIGLPGVLKTRRLGYDGKGQAVLRRKADIGAAWDALGTAPLLYEQMIDFDYEVSIIGVRGLNGQIAVYPLNRNLHRDGILRLTRAPWRAPKVEAAAQRHVRRVLRAFDYVGVLTIEFFVTKGGVLANEMAPRVHNSGHWTIEGAVTSQFENHIRAISGLPLGATVARGHSAMLNLIGRLPDRAALLAQPGLHWHDYGKSPREGRKLGHLTVVEATAAAADRRAAALLRRLG